MYSFEGQGYSVETLEDVQPECRTGPLRLVITKTGGRVTDLSAAVGVTWRAGSMATDLGTVPAAQAAAWLLDVAQGTPDDRLQSVAFVAANAADSVRIADRLFSLTRDKKQRADLRARALRWLGEAARREGRSDEADALQRAIVRDAGDVTSVRERAIRELNATNANDEFLRNVYRDLSVAVLKERIIRMLAASPSDQNVAWIRGVATDRTEQRELRDRAIRVLGEELNRKGDVRALYGALEDPTLKDRVLRVVAAAGDSASARWLREIAVSETEPLEARDRAIRVLAEQGATSADLAALYERVQGMPLRQRVVKLLVERGDDVAIEKLMQIADRDPDPAQRRYVLRRLSETQNPKARVFLENKVVR
jgi:hypothetical protein